MIEPNQKLCFSLAECSAATSISIPMLRKEITADRLKTRRAGRKILIMRDDLMDYLNESDEKETNGDV